MKKEFVIRAKPANKPVFGVAICPKCHKRNPIFWSGNFMWRCVHCYTEFKVKRQKLLDVETPSMPLPREEQTNE